MLNKIIKHVQDNAKYREHHDGKNYHVRYKCRFYIAKSPSELVELISKGKNK